MTLSSTFEKVPSTGTSVIGLVDSTGSVELQPQPRKRWGTKSLLALFDQAVVSGMSLIASVVIGRGCGAEGLGIYSLAISINVLLTAIHTALISTPYTVFRTRLNEHDAKVFAGSSLISTVFVSLIGTVGLLIAVPIFYFYQLVPSFESVILTLACTIPLSISREFARRFGFAHFRMASSVLIDAATAGLQLMGLGALLYFRSLTPVTALICLGLACGLASGFWLWGHRDHFLIEFSSLRAHLQRKWKFGKWVLMESVLTVFSACVIPWLLVFMIDSTATGVLAACLVVVNLSSPFLQGMGNSLAPQFSQAAASHEIAPVKNLFWKATLFMTGTMAAFVVFCWFAGETLMNVLYDAPEYRGHGLIVVLLAIKCMSGSANISAHHALLAMEKPLPNFYCSLIGLVITLIGGLVLIPVYGILGGAIAMLVGTVCETIAIYIGYHVVLSAWGHPHQEDSTLSL